MVVLVTGGIAAGHRLALENLEEEQGMTTEHG